MLSNSHDGYASFKLSAGLFREICSNGMVVCDTLFNKIHIRHMGYSFRRVEDKGKSLWHIHNVVQENLFKGGIRSRVFNEEKRRYVRRTTRTVKGMNAYVDINKALWGLTERFAQASK